MLEIDKFLFPNDLEITPTSIGKALFIGSCMMETYVKRFTQARPDTQIDFVLFNNVADMPATPPSPLSEYDFQFIQIPFRHVVGDIVIDFTKFSDLAINKDIVENAKQALTLMLDSALKYNKDRKILTFVQNFIVPQTPIVAGLSARGSELDLRYIVQSMNQVIHEIVSEHENVFLIDVDMIASSMGKRYILDDIFNFYTHGEFFFDDWHVFEGGRIEKVPPITTISPSHLDQFFKAVWRAIEYNYRSINQIDSVKLVIFDLDDTLWRGIIGEHYGDEGPHPLKIGWPMGVHEAIHHLKARGILVAVCSKNSPELVAQRWERAVPFGWISLDDFVCVEINWQPKSEAVGRILADVNLTPRNVVFVDDNPVEREAIVAAYPGIRAIGSNPFLTKLVLLNAPETQPRSITAESTMRDAMIRRQKVRNADRHSMSREEFLKNLNCRLILREAVNSADRSFQRAFELLNKTNQFNTTGKRWTTAEINDFFEKGGKIIFFRADDKYTTYGLVGVILLLGNEIVQFAMSCRILGLEIETSAIGIVVDHLREKGWRGEIEASIVETDANIVCRDVYARAGFANMGNGRFVLASGPASPAGTHLTIDAGPLTKPKETV